MKVVLYKGTHRLAVIGRIRRLSPEFGVMLDDVVSVQDDGKEALQQQYATAKTLFEGRWIVEYIAIKPVPDEVVLGMKM